MFQRFPLSRREVTTYLLSTLDSYFIEEDGLNNLSHKNLQKSRNSDFIVSLNSQSGHVAAIILWVQFSSWEKSDHFEEKKSDHYVIALFSEIDAAATTTSSSVFDVFENSFFLHALLCKSIFFFLFLFLSFSFSTLQSC